MYRKWTVGGAIALVGAAALTIPSAAAEERPAAVVPGCELGCETTFSVPLAGGARLDGVRTKTGESPASILAYWDGTTLRGSTQVRGIDGYPYSTATSAVCAAERCSVSFDYGAHSSAVASVLLDAGITVTDVAEGDAGGAATPDLNGDGRPDAVVKGSTYEPSFAEAPQYWATFVERNGHFARTGCTTPVRETSFAPTAVATGACPDL
jgi:hypothetical protein